MMRVRHKRLTPKRTITLILTLALGLLAAQYSEGISSSINENNPTLYRVTKVSDGDTIQVEKAGYKDTVRLIGIDTPETKDPRREVQCFGQAASNYTKKLLLGKSVRLEADPSDSNRDKYGRLLRYVYLDETLVNAQLIREGYAFAYTVFPYSKIEEFRQLEREAHEEERGLWGGCEVDESGRVKQTTREK